MEHSLSISTLTSEKSFDFIDSPLLGSPSVAAESKIIPAFPDRKTKMRIEGHRGAGALEPENTLKAFQKAIDISIDGVELDVWISADGVPIVVHGTDEGLLHFKDSTLNTYAHLVHSKDLKDWRLPNDENIPTLEEVLVLCKGKVNVNIEFKEEDERVVKPTVELVQGMDMINQVCFSSFLHRHKDRLEEVKKELSIEQHLEFGFLVWQLNDFGEYKHRAMRGDTLNIDLDLLVKHEEFIMGEIAQARELNLRIKFYFGFHIDETEDVYRRMEALQVDTLIVNHPLRGVRFFDDMGSSSA